MWKAIPGCVAIAMMLQGCVGTTTVLSKADQQALQSFQLFNPDTSARFTLDLACVSRDMSCLTVENTFSDWAQRRHIAMRRVESEDLLRKQTQRAQARKPVMPYRLAVRFAPLVVASYNMINTQGDRMTGDYTPPSISYAATLYIFDATTGKLLREVPFHEKRTGDFQGEANPFIRAEVNGFIASLDPAFGS